ncbi:MAG: homoserine dehydrogenase [Planctomycetaceae bacterium]|jgi:homoserine dehydrogenase|nr:homoserine dehydrogenase [Planctomycetaceae bacterium]
MSKIKIALFGLGTIGTGVADIFLNKKEHIRKITGHDVSLAQICDKDTLSKRDINIPSDILTNNPDSIFNNPEISVGIELIGGIEPARTFVLQLLNNGKNVVTANKALLAQHGAELFEAARRNNCTIAFEAAVCGGIPIISSIATSLQANTILSINAIVNGTSNFILSQMEDGGTSYSDAVKEAQKLGYAEANPAMDVDGTDAVQKLTILAQLGFGADIDWKNISRMGIESVDAIDFKFAKNLGYRIKLLAVANRGDDGLELHVAPTLVKRDSPLARVHNAFNAVQVVGDYVGPAFFQGLGAGRKPTASAVVGDVIDTILGRTKITFDTLNLWNKNNEIVPIKNINNFYGKSYLRFDAEDRPGVMRDFAAVFGKKNISIASMIQHEISNPDNNNSNKQRAVIILITHESSEGDLLEAIKELENIPSIQGKIIRMRVQD